MHEALRDTIAEPGTLPTPGPVVTMMCHEHPDNAPERCVGWLANQLALGNVALRLRMTSCTNLAAIRLDGPQHPTFNDTLPKSNFLPNMDPDQQHKNRVNHLIADFQNDLFGPGGLFEEEEDNPQAYADHLKETRQVVGEPYAQKIEREKEQPSTEQ
jgi:hypothetical protein